LALNERDKKKDALRNSTRNQLGGIERWLGSRRETTQKPEWGGQSEDKKNFGPNAAKILTAARGKRGKENGGTFVTVG